MTRNLRIRSRLGVIPLMTLLNQVAQAADTAVVEVPEPGTLALIALGLLALAVRRWNTTHKR
jgi:hypothetical protein